MGNEVNINFEVRKATLTRVDDKKVASGAINTIVCNFDFDKTWRGLTAFCRFEGAGGVKDVRINDAACVVPWEVIEAPGFTMACYGVQSSDKQLTTTKETVKVYQSVNFIADGAALPKDATPSLVKQYEDIVKTAVADQVKNNADQKANNARADAMVTEVSGLVNERLQPLVDETTAAKDAANAAAVRADNAVVDLESGNIPIMSDAEIDEIFGK